MKNLTKLVVGFSLLGTAFVSNAAINNEQIQSVSLSQQQVTITLEGVNLDSNDPGMGCPSWPENCK